MLIITVGGSIINLDKVAVFKVTKGYLDGEAKHNTVAIFENTVDDLVLSVHSSVDEAYKQLDNLTNAYEDGEKVFEFHDSKK